MSNIEYYQEDDFHTKELEVSKESTETALILGFPYSFYPYLHPITKLMEGDYRLDKVILGGVR